MHIQAYGFHVGVTYNTSEENILKNPVLRLLKSHHTMAGDSLLIHEELCKTNFHKNHDILICQNLLLQVIS